MGMTKTDARELKSLVKSDFATLEERTEHRYREMAQTLKDERVRRNQEIQKQAHKELASLRAQYTRLANKTQEVLDDLANQGWSIGRYTWECKFNADGIKPPHYNQHEDLDEEARELDAQFRSVKEGLQDEKARLLRKLVLSILSSDEAHAFLTEVPTAEELMPTPPYIAKLEERADGGNR